MPRAESICHLEIKQNKNKHNNQCIPGYGLDVKHKSLLTHDTKCMQVLPSAGSVGHRPTAGQFLEGGP